MTNITMFSLTKGSVISVALLQNQNEEMRKHMERMEHGFVRKKKPQVRRDGLRSEREIKSETGARRLFGSPLIRTTVKSGCAFSF